MRCASSSRTVPWSTRAGSARAQETSLRALDKILVGLSFALGLATIAGAWGSQLIGGLVPCELCLEQRLAYYWGLPILAAVLLLWNRLPLPVWYLAMASAAALGACTTTPYRFARPVIVDICDSYGAMTCRSSDSPNTDPCFSSTPITVNGKRLIFSSRPTSVYDRPANNSAIA